MVKLFTLERQNICFVVSGLVPNIIIFFNFHLIVYIYSDHKVLYLDETASIYCNEPVHKISLIDS